MSLNNIGSNNPMYGKKLLSESIKQAINTRTQNGFSYDGENNPNFKFKITKTELTFLYLEKKLSLSEIAKYYQCSYVLIVKKIIKFNLTRDHTRKKFFFNIVEIEDFLKKGYTQRKIAASAVRDCAYYSRCRL